MQINIQRVRAEEKQVESLKAINPNTNHKMEIEILSMEKKVCDTMYTQFMKQESKKKIRFDIDLCAVIRIY